MKMTMMLFFSLLAIVTTGFADTLVLENQTSYPAKKEKSKLAVQWASCGREVDDGNNALLYGSKLNPDSLQMLSAPGTVTLNIPKKAEYFRILIWSKGGKDPDFLTNWVDIVPNKTYTLKPDHLVPAVLMAGTGC